VADLSGVGLGADADEPARSDRAQIILVGAFALAVVFIALALVMNAAIYTENLATRSESAGTADAAAFQRSTTTVAEDVFQYAHEVNDSDYAGLERNVTDGIEAYDNVTRTQQASGNQLTGVSVASTTDGTNITDNESDFQSPSNTDDWTLATGVTQTREFRLKTDTLNFPSTEEFRVVADDASTWYLNISAEGTGYEVGVNDSGTYTQCATPSIQAITVDFSNGTVNGNSCAALDLHEVSGPYALKFENSSTVTGAYTVIVDSDETYTSPDSDDPTTEPVLYSMEVDMTYWTSELRYETSIRVAPGEYDE